MTYRKIACGCQCEDWPVGVGRLKQRSDGAGVGMMPAPAFGLEPAYILNRPASTDEMQKHAR